MKKNYPPKGTFYMYPQYDNNDLVGFTTDYEGEGAYGKLCKIISTGETLIRCNGGDLEVKEVDLDLEKELYKAFGQVKDFTLGVHIARYFFELGIKAQKGDKL